MNTATILSDADKGDRESLTRAWHRFEATQWYPLVQDGKIALNDLKAELRDHIGAIRTHMDVSEIAFDKLRAILGINDHWSYSLAHLKTHSADLAKS